MIGSRTWINTLAIIPLLVIVLISAGCQERSEGAGGGMWQQSQPQPNAALQSLVDGNSLGAAVSGSQMSAAEQKRLTDQVRRFYQAQNYQLIWINGSKPSKRFGELVKVLDAAEDHGLPAALYRTPLHDPSVANAQIASERAPELDVQTTAAFFRYFLHLTSGRLDPRELQSLWTLRPKRPDLVDALTGAIRNNDLVRVMQELQPPQQEYREMQQALKRYRAIASKGGWPSVPTIARLKPGEQSTVVPVLRQRLAIEGDLDAAHEKDPSPVYDATLVDAVKRFEERHRIKPDGLVDAELVKAMNVPVEMRIRTIELNLERWRWLPNEMPARYIFVNVPDFRLETIENGKTVMDMRVVVGAADNKTPIFADEMTHVVFSPYWNVPPNIAQEETIPRAARDPGFLDRNNMEVVGPSGDVVDPSSVDWSSANGYRVRQRPGSGNALGGVKFMFPNNFDVYLHDTNATTLFDRIERGLSHGCVRVEEPYKLAQYVLRDQPDWTPEAIDEAMKSGREKHVKLKAAIPVFIVYKTAWVHQGGVRFLKDLYGHDADQAAKLWPPS